MIFFMCFFSLSLEYIGEQSFFYTSFLFLYAYLNSNIFFYVKFFLFLAQIFCNYRIEFMSRINNLFMTIKKITAINIDNDQLIDESMKLIRQVISTSRDD